MPLIVVAAIVVILSGVVFQQTRGDTISPQITPSPTEPASIPTPSPTPLPSPSSLIIPHLPKPSISQPSIISQSLNLRYPGSLETSPGVYTSPDDTDKITDWYKSQINESGFNVKTYVKTNSNYKVLNKLAASKNTNDVNIEISKNPGDSVTKIVVVIDNN
jgi:hypothetical protein